MSPDREENSERVGFKELHNYQEVSQHWEPVYLNSGFSAGKVTDDHKPMLVEAEKKMYVFFGVVGKI